MTEKNQQSPKEWSLDLIEIPNPCTVPWSSMTGNSQVRFCDQCEKNVYNLSGLSQKEATNLVLTGEGKICVSMLKRADGTIVTDECPRLLRPMRDGLKRAATAVSALLAMMISAVPVRAGDTSASSPTTNKPKGESKCSAKTPTEPALQPMGGAPVIQPNPQITPPEPRKMGEIAIPNPADNIEAYRKTAISKVKEGLKTAGIVAKATTLQIEIAKDGKIKSCSQTGAAASAGEKMIAVVTKIQLPPLPPSYKEESLKLSISLP